MENATCQEEAAKDLRCNYLLARRRVRAFQRGLGSMYPLAEMRNVRCWVLMSFAGFFFTGLLSLFRDFDGCSMVFRISIWDQRITSVKHGVSRPKCLWLQRKNIGFWLLVTLYPFCRDVSYSHLHLRRSWVSNLSCRCDMFPLLGKVLVASISVALGGLDIT